MKAGANKKRKAGPVKRKHSATKVGFKTQGVPTVDDFRQAVGLQIAFRGKHNHPLVNFLTKWNANLEDGWLRNLVSPSTTQKSSRSSPLSKDERALLGYLGTVLSCGHVSGWDATLAPAFGVGKTKAKESKKDHFEVHIFDSLEASHTHAQSTPGKPKLKRERLVAITTHREEETIEVEAINSSSDDDVPPLSYRPSNFDDVPPLSYRPSNPRVTITLPCDEEEHIEVETLDSSFDDSPRLRGPEQALFECDDSNFATPQKDRVNRFPADDMDVVAPTVVGTIQRLFRRPTTTADAFTGGASTLLASARKVAENIRGIFGHPEAAEDKAELMKAVDMIYSKAINPKTLDEDVLGLAAEILRVAEEQSPRSNKGILTIRIKTPSSRRSTTRVFAQIPVPRKARKKATEASERERYRKHATLLQGFLQALCGETEVQEQREVLQYLAEQKMKGVLNWEEFMLDVEDCLTIREMVPGTSTNALLTILTSAARLSDQPKLLPTCLKRKIGELEMLLPEIAHRLVRVQTGKENDAQRVFYWIVSLPYLLELLVAAAIHDGKQEDSFDFSNFVDTHVFFRGIDKGGNALVDMVRYGNRKDGNSGAFCVPISVVEDTAETIINMLGTTLSAARSKVTEPLHQQKLHMFEIHLNGPSILLAKHACCMMVHFKVADCDGFHPRLLSVSEVTVEDLEIISTKEDLLEFQRVAADARARETVCDVPLQNHMLLQSDNNGMLAFDLKLGLRLVGLSEGGGLDGDGENDGESYIGCKLYWINQHNRDDDVPLYAFKFGIPINGVFNTTTAVANCKKALSINSDDGKMQTAVTGIGTCANTNSCPRCTKPTSATKPPCWCHDACPDLITQAECEDHALREGDYSYGKMYEQYERLRGACNEYTASGSTQVPKHVIDATKSISSALARWIDIRLLHGEPMHELMGCFTHLTEQTIAMLRKICDSESTWAKENKEKFEARAKTILGLEKSERYLNAKRNHARLTAQQKKLEQQLKVAKMASNAQRVSELELSLNDMAESIAIDSEVHKFGLMNMQIKEPKRFPS